MSGSKKEGAVHLHRFNWFDWLLLGLILIGIVAGIFIFRFFSKGDAQETGTITYTVIVSSVESDLFSEGEDVILVGDQVRSQNGTAVLGEVESFRRVPHQIAAVENGKVVFAQDPHLEDYYVTVRSQATRKTGDGIRVGDIRLAAGMKVTLRIGDFYISSAEMISVEWEAADA